MKLKNLFLINKLNYIIIIGFLSSCAYEKENIPFTQYANNYRDNNYFYVNQFPMSSWNTYSIDKNSKSGVIQAPLALNGNKLILAYDDGTVKLIENSKLVNTFKTKDNELVCSNLAADKNENIYAMTLNGNLHSINKTGKLNWIKNFSDTSIKFQSYSDLLITNKSIFISSNSGLTSKLDLQGKEVWNYKSNLSVLDYSAAFENDDLVIGLTNSMINSTDSILCFENDGHIKWQIGIQNFRLIRGLTICGDKIIARGYTYKNGEKDPKILCFDKNGKLLWEQMVDIIPFYISCDNNGRIFVAGFNSGVADALSGFYSFDNSGKLLWKNFIKATIVSEIMISKKIFLFIGQTNAGFAAFYMQNIDGINFKNIPLGNFSMLYSQPAILNDGSIVFGSTDISDLVIIEKTQIEKLLPF